MADLDWNALEDAYRKGDLSVRELARRFACSDTAIRKRAARDGWVVGEEKPVVVEREPISEIPREPARKPVRIIQSLVAPDPPPAPSEPTQPALEPEEPTCEIPASGSAYIVNSAQMALVAGVSLSTLSMWIAEGMPHFKPSVNRCHFNLIESLVWIRDNKWTNVDDKDRLARIKADDAQLDFDLKLGTLMRVSDATKVWESACATMRARMLSIPPVAQQRLALTVPQVQDLTGMVHEALEVLSGRMDPIPDDDPDAPEPEKPRPAGHKKPGRPRKNA